MSGHRLLSAAAARLGAGAASAALATAPAPAPAAPVASVTPAASTDEAPVDVVTVVEAQAAVRDAETRGATAERERTNAVMASDGGKANPQMAAFMLHSNPGATAASIVAHLDTMPKPAAGGEAAAPAPAAAAPAITTPLRETPKVDAAAPANDASVGDGLSGTDATKFWDGAMAGAAASASAHFGAPLAPGLPRTGN